jgi:DNA-binding transcriptional MerR regulator
MEILSLNTCAEDLGVTVRSLRHYLTKDQIVPYRQLRLGGDTHVRYFTAEDVQTIRKWWSQGHTVQEVPNHGD